MNGAPASTNDFLKKVRHPLGFRLFLLKNLPAAWFSGVRIEEASGEEATVTVPYSWRSRNPFRSTYFACLAMAAEMSTGLLAMMAIRSGSQPVSMLVVNIEGEFFKKATGKTFFTCTDGAAMKDAVAQAVATAAGQSFTATATGRDAAGTAIATFRITWSFKLKTKK